MTAREVLFTAAELLREIPARGLLTAIFVASDNPDAREEARDLLREHLGVTDLLDWQRAHTAAEAADALSAAAGGADGRLEGVEPGAAP